MRLKIEFFEKNLYDGLECFLEHANGMQEYKGYMTVTISRRRRSSAYFWGISVSHDPIAI